MKKGYKIPISNERGVAWVEALAKKGFNIIVEDGRIFVLIGGAGYEKIKPVAYKATLQLLQGITNNKKPEKLFNQLRLKNMKNQSSVI